MENRIRILVGDDHPIIREGLIKILSAQEDFEVIGEASTGTEVIKNVSELKPDILLLDLEMPGMKGIEVIKRLHEMGSNVRVIVFTAFDTDERIVATVKAGAHGYLLKGAPREEILQAVRIVHKGGSSLEPFVASKLMRQVSQGVDQMTPRELEVLGLLSKGITNKEIAKILFISERTVKFHTSSIFTKLNAESRTEAVTIAAKKGLITL